MPDQALCRLRICVIDGLLNLPVRRFVARIVERKGGFMSSHVCPSCGSSKFRTSRLRSSDFSKLLALQYPVRCKVCKERSFAFFVTALFLPRKARKKQQPLAQNGDA